MKPVEFDDDHPISKDDLRKMLFEDENDPRSVEYKRVLVRPEIKWIRVAAYLLIPAAILIIAGVLLSQTDLPGWAVASIIIAAAIIYIAVTLKRAVICSVRIYQHFAPDSVRNKCRFEPSCSEYMILAIEKYGLIKGVRRGIERLKRCNVNGGGFDMP